MAGVPFVNDIDMRGNEILDFRIPRVNGLPTATLAMNGWMLYNTQDDRYYIARAAAWRRIDENLGTLEGVTAAQLRDRTTHTGTVGMSTIISDYDAVIKAYRLNQLTAPDAAVSLGSQKITNLAPGTTGTDGINKNQLDAVAAIANAGASGVALKAPVRVVSKSNITLSATQTIDGVALAVGDRVLVAGQTTNTANGLYVVASGAWTRTTDADATGELAAGTMVNVAEGTAEADTLWGLVTNGAITIGTTGQTWSRVLAGSNGEIIVAGNGISKTGTTLAVVPRSGGGLTVDGTGVGVDATVARSATGTIPSGSTSATFTHNLGVANPVFEIYETGTGLRVFCPVTSSGINSAVAEFKTAPTTNQYSWKAVG